MRDRIIIALAVLFIGACALITFVKIQAHYTTPDYQAPAVWTPAPLVPDTASATASSTAAEPASTTVRPRRTVTTWVTVTAGDAG